jgi:tetratricopeptide (TPR) repeat protein
LNLFKFIKGLTPEELKVILAAFDSKKLGSAQNAVTLEGAFFNIVTATPLEELSDEFIIQKLGGLESDNAYEKLKSRVFLKILDRICSDEFISKDEFIEGVDRVMIRIKKKLLQARILNGKTSKTDPDTVIHLLNEVIEEAKEYELFDGIVEALTNKKYYVANRLGYKEFQKIQAEIEFYEACSKSRRAANDYYYVIISNQKLISHLSEKEVEEYVSEKIKKLENDPFTTVSTGVQYYYKLLKLAQYQAQNKITEAIDTCLETLSLLNRSKAIKRVERFGFVYSNLSECWLLQKRFKEAAQTARAALHYFPHDSFSYMIAKEQEFYACFYGKDYDRCREIMDALLAHNKRDTGEIRYDKFTYFSGCLDFAQGKFKEAKRISSLALQILKDKSRWEFGVRYLKIMTLVELGEFAEAGDAIESLRKQIQRMKKEGKEISLRDEIIFKALNEFSIGGFGTDVSNKLIYLLKKLSMKDTEYSWKFYSHEMISVNRWIKKKIRLRPETQRSLRKLAQKK